jgi:hypothetical protein
VNVQSEAVRAKVERVKAALTPTAVDPVMERVGLETFRELVEATPKRWFGQVRAGWRIEKPKEGERVVINRNKVMLFLEAGTANQGTGFIEPKEKKALYIPLNRRAAMGWVEGLKYGVDYILRMRVRGIKPRWIVHKERKKARARLMKALKEHVRKVLHG